MRLVRVSEREVLQKPPGQCSRKRISFEKEKMSPLFIAHSFFNSMKKKQK